jgi:hypothetical protein
MVDGGGGGCGGPKGVEGRCEGGVRGGGDLEKRSK